VRSIREVLIDTWAGLSHKMPMSDTLQDRATSQIKGFAPSGWTGEDNRRRLTAYMILSAYDENISRAFLATTDEKDRDERREYGDAGLVIDQTLAAILGDSQEIVVDGAEDYDPELENQPEADPAAEGVQPNPPTAVELAANAAARALADAQEHLREWADSVHLPLRLVDVERNAVGLGDGCILLGWDDEAGRPVPSVMEPGFYFPVLPDTLDAYRYPDRVHFAWELPAEDHPDGKVRVRRITYERRLLAPIFDELAEEGTDPFKLPEGTAWRRDSEGFREVVRQYPWNEDGDPSRYSVFLTDATWLLDDLNDAHNVDAFDVGKAELRYDEHGEVLDRDIGIDFLPIVHIPNTPPGGEHFGKSTLTKVLQVLDDIQNADTDAQAASATTGSPIIGVSGSATGGDDPLTGRRGQPLEVRPGIVFRLGENGSMEVLDTSAGLAATRDYVEHLLERLSVNARIPAAVLGRLKPSEVPSGFAMQLSFGPLTSMVRTARLVRAVKYPLLLKMVWRLYQINDPENFPPGPTPRAELRLGNYLPSDMQGTLSAVKDAYTAKLISLETAVVMLMEVGFTIEDVAAEIALIEGRDFEGAGLLVDATGDTGLAYDYLGLDRPDTAQPAPVQQPPIVPPASGGAGAGA
jgi:hypothetical protein